MALAHLHMSIQNRRRTSALLKAAYNTASALDTPLGPADYRRKSHCLAAQLILADGIQYQDRQEFWASVEAREKRKDSVLSREMNISLPIELEPEAQKELAETFARAILTRYDLAGVDLAIHDPPLKARRSKSTGQIHSTGRKPSAKSESQPHFHLQFPDRDRNGKKLLVLQRNPAEIRAIRLLWQDACNAALEAAGLDARIDMRSYTDQIAELEEDVAELQALIEQKEKDLNASIQELKNAIARDNARRTETTRNYTIKADSTAIGLADDNIGIDKVNSHSHGRTTKKTDNRGTKQRDIVSDKMDDNRNREFEQRPGNFRESQTEQHTEEIGTQSLQNRTNDLQSQLRTLKNLLEINIQKLQELRNLQEIENAQITFNTACGSAEQERGTSETEKSPGGQRKRTKRPHQ